jgi:hypothetical protein
MADIITLTQQPIRISATTTQERYLAVDVGPYDLLDLALYCASVESTPNVTIKIITGMQTQTDSDGWVDLVSFTALTSASVNTSEIKSVSTGMLRYIRWKATLNSGSGSVTFWLRAMARSYA